MLLQRRVGQQQALGRGRQSQRHLGHLAHGNARGQRVQRHHRQPLLGHAVGQRLHAHHLAWQHLARARAQRDARHQPRRQPGRAALVHPQLHPQARRVHQPQHRLARHHRAAAFGVAAGHQRRGRGHQFQIAALLRQRRALGPQTDDVLRAAAQVGLRRLQPRVGRRHFLRARFQRRTADEALPRQVLVAFEIRRRERAPRHRVAHLRLGRLPRALRTGQRGVQRGQALVQVHRVHLGQRLAGLHRVAHVHLHRAHPPGHRGPHQPAAPRLHLANAEDLRRHAAGLHRRHLHLHRGQRSGAQRHKGQRGHQRQRQTAQQQAACVRGFHRHGEPSGEGSGGVVRAATPL